MLQIFRAVLAVLLIGALPVIVAEEKPDTAKIKKCQDAMGKWHYGDFADSECAKSKVEVLTDQGIKKKEIAAPLTDAELADRARRKDEIEQEQRSAEERTKRDQILLQTYAVEDDIILIRDRKLSQLESTISGTEQTLKSLRGALTRMEAQRESELKTDPKAVEQTDKNIAQTKSQIERHEALIVQKRNEQEKLRAQYAVELERYRELKRKAPTTKAAQ